MTVSSLKVENWGQCFLDRMEYFFHEMEHCDLTLQFSDNSQLKVHRLVLSASTDYFNQLESVGDNVLIMPTDLPADVVVPIVNFMYTGRIDFKNANYERLLKAATDMNLIVLLKLLQNDRQTNLISKQPVLHNKFGQRIERTMLSQRTFTMRKLNHGRRTETPFSGPSTVADDGKIKFD